jgi:hypothetical protein
VGYIWCQDADARPLFPPQAVNTVKDQVLRVLGTAPQQYGLQRSRWRLADLLGLLPLAVTSRSGLWQALRRLGIRYRQGWAYLVSPDPWAADKLAWIAALQQRALAQPERVVLLWLDELTFYRLPSLAATWCDGQGRPAKAQMRGGNNTCARVVAALNAGTGNIAYLLRSHIGVHELCRFYRHLRAAYPEAEEIYVIQDCWPVHFLTEVCASAGQCGITLVPLPTYASWRNPIEKLWRWLKQEVLHMHRWADDWEQTKQSVHAFLTRFAQPNTALLHYVGLSD